MRPAARWLFDLYDGDELIKTEDAAAVPATARYVQVEGKRVAVARVVRRDAPGGQAIEQYGADGMLLARTSMLKDPPNGAR